MKHKRFGTGLGRKVLACLVSAAMVVAFAPTVAWGSTADSIEEKPGSGLPGYEGGGGSGGSDYDDWYDPTPTPTLSKIGDTLPNTSMPSGTATTSSGTNIPLTGSIKLISDVPGVDDKGNPTAGSVCLFELDFSYNFSNPSESTITVTIPSTVKVGGKSYGVTSLGAVSTDPSAAESAMFLKVFQGQLAQTLEALNIPLTVTKIEQEAFTNCTKLQQLKMMVSQALSIGNNAFAGLPNLSNVEATIAAQQPSAADEPQTVSITLGAGSFAKAYALAMFAIKAAAGSNGLADIEMTIGDQTFEGCKSLFSAEFQAIIQSIGAKAFQGCTDLEKLAGVVQSSGIGTLSTRALRPRADVSASSQPAFPTKVGIGAFEGCVSLTTVELSGGLGDVEQGAFKGCSELSSVPASSGSIGSYAFAGCTSLPSLPACSGAIGDYAFLNCSALTAVPAGATSYGKGAFSGSGVKSVTIPKGVKLSTGVFENCKKLASATVAKGVTGLPASTFKGCSKLSKVTLGSSLGAIGSQALAGCAKLKSLTLPKSVKSIGSKALAGCGKLTKLTVKSTQLTKKGVAGALKGSSVATVYVPKSKLKAYGKIFMRSVCGKKVACEKIA